MEEESRGTPRDAREAGDRVLPPRALVVEDEFVVLMDLNGQLESLGCEVVGTAQDAESAIELALSLRPDLVLMDLGLGGPDGVGAIRAIVAQTQARVIAVTAYGQEQARRAKEAGACRVLTKPVGEAQLAEAISQLIGGGIAKQGETQQMQDRARRQQ